MRIKDILSHPRYTLSNLYTGEVLYNLRMRSETVIYVINIEDLNVKGNIILRKWSVLNVATINYLKLFLHSLKSSCYYS